MKVTRLRRSDIGICSVRRVFGGIESCCLRFATQSVCPEVHICDMSKMLVLEADSHFLWKSWKMLMFKAWILTFGESLVENASFGSLDCHFW